MAAASHRLSGDTVWTVPVPVADALAAVAFDPFGRGLSPVFGCSRVAPMGLAQQVLSRALGDTPAAAAYTLRMVTEPEFYPLGYLLVARWRARRVMTLRWPLIAVGYRTTLWVFAVYVTATPVAGNPAFLGFTRVALVGHSLFAVVAAAIMEHRLQHPRGAAAAP
ncbi:hypothetical protein [Jannaschia rubra]|uniref:hypothetical protein n=1 Tax=Jannaschia rubra TaxID=282197 RepID=UPI0024921B60|nr:hypothetical protein [Jannaschia rubra]